MLWWFCSLTEFLGFYFKNSLEHGIYFIGRSSRNVEKQQTQCTYCANWQCNLYILMWFGSFIITHSQHEKKYFFIYVDRKTHRSAWTLDTLECVHEQRSDCILRIYRKGLFILFNLIIIFIEQFDTFALQRRQKEILLKVPSSKFNVQTCWSSVKYIFFC